MGMSKNISNFLNSINDKRITRALQKVFDQTQPINLDTAITAHAGGGQANAKALRQDCAYHDVTTVATVNDSVVLPDAMVGEVHFVKNSAALSMQVFAPTPGTIDSVATGTGVAQAAGDGVLYICVVQGNYLRFGGLDATEIFTTIQATTVRAGSSGVSGTVEIFPPTGAKGKVTFNKADNTNNDTIRLTVAAMGQSADIFLPDPAQASAHIMMSTSAILPAEGNFLKGVSAGIAAASKAVTLDANKTVSGVSAMYATDLRAGASGVSGTLEVFPPTGSKGRVTFKKTDNTNNDTTVFDIGAQSVSGTITVPDANAATAFVMLSTSAITPAEGNVLKGVTAGTVTASKAMVVDANSAVNIVRTANIKVGTAGSEDELLVPVPAMYHELTLTNCVVFAARKWQLDSAKVRVTTQTTTASKMHLYKVASGVVTVASGTMLSQTGINLSAASANETRTFSLTASTADLTLNTADHLAWEISGTVTAGLGLVTCSLKAV